MLCAPRSRSLPDFCATVKGDPPAKSPRYELPKRLCLGSRQAGTC